MRHALEALNLSKKEWEKLIKDARNQIAWGVEDSDEDPEKWIAYVEILAPLDPDENQPRELLDTVCDAVMDVAKKIPSCEISLGELLYFNGDAWEEKFGEIDFRAAKLGYSKYDGKIFYITVYGDFNDFNYVQSYPKNLR